VGRTNTTAVVKLLGYRHSSCCFRTISHQISRLLGASCMCLVRVLSGAGSNTGVLDAKGHVCLPLCTLETPGASMDWIVANLSSVIIVRNICTVHQNCSTSF
jgi:hypothetical protein